MRRTSTATPGTAVASPPAAGARRKSAAVPAPNMAIPSASSTTPTRRSTAAATLGLPPTSPPHSGHSPRGGHTTHQPHVVVQTMSRTGSYPAPLSDAAPPPPSPRTNLESSTATHHKDVEDETTHTAAGERPASSAAPAPLLTAPPSAATLSSSNRVDPPSENGGGALGSFTEQETRYFRKMFGMFDTDHSGAIGYFEMKNLARHLGVQISDEQLQKSIERVDDNGNGELEFEEFMQWLANVNDNSDGEGDQFAVLKSKIRAQGARPLTSSQIEQFKAVFHHFDTDGSGTIDMEELGNVFEAMGQTLTTEELQSVLRHADDDGSGEIDFDEFLMLMCCSFGAEKSFEADLMETFRRYDVDADGLISARDLRQLVCELVGDTMTNAEMDEVVEVAAVERGDGYVEYLKWESLWDACRGLV